MEEIIPYKFNLGQKVVIDKLCEWVGMPGVVKERLRAIPFHLDGDDEVSYNNYLVVAKGHADWYTEDELDRFIEPFRESDELQVQCRSVSVD
jgi:hypothetical protein